MFISDMKFRYRSCSCFGVSVELINIFSTVLISVCRRALFIVIEVVL